VRRILVRGCAIKEKIQGEADVGPIGDPPIHPPIIRSTAHHQTTSVVAPFAGPHLEIVALKLAIRLRPRICLRFV
jgi:hypothetical protein